MACNIEQEEEEKHVCQHQKSEVCVHQLLGVLVHHLLVSFSDSSAPILVDAPSLDAADLYYFKQEVRKYQFSKDTLSHEKNQPP